MLNTIVEWAKKEDAVRAVVLTGSRASTRGTDQFSDFDVALFVTNQKTYTADDSWMHTWGTVWVCIPETNAQGVPMRLIIFEGGVGVDIALWNTKQLADFVAKKQLPFACHEGYQVLLDKDGLAKQLPPAPGKRPPIVRPTEKEFVDAINIFFFEAFHAAKYLARNDLWHAKLRDWTTKEYLLKMIEWHEAAQHGWDYDTFWHGKFMRAWTSSETWAALGTCFGHFDAADSWKALLATMNLFRHLATQTAASLGYRYPSALDHNITGFVCSLKDR